MRFEGPGRPTQRGYSKTAHGALSPRLSRAELRELLQRKGETLSLREVRPKGSVELRDGPPQNGWVCISKKRTCALKCPEWIGQRQKQEQIGRSTQGVFAQQYGMVAKNRGLPQDLVFSVLLTSLGSFSYAFP